jgi:hypothetical protein
MALTPEQKEHYISLHVQAAIIKADVCTLTGQQREITEIIENLSNAFDNSYRYDGKTVVKNATIECVSPSVASDIIKHKMVLRCYQVEIHKMNQRLYQLGTEILKIESRITANRDHIMLRIQKDIDNCSAAPQISPQTKKEIV